MREKMPAAECSDLHFTREEQNLIYLLNDP